MIQPDEDDYWQGLEGAATASPVSAAFPELQVRIIPEARPLIHALGNFDPRAIPEPLEAVLFAPDGPAADLGGIRAFAADAKAPRAGAKSGL